MKGYKQLSLLEREQIFGWRKEKVSFREIGRRLNRPHTTLTREYVRNAKYGASYLPCEAQEKSDKRSVKQRSQASWKGPEVYLYIRDHLKDKRYLWSPEQIAGRISFDHPKLHICHETIYQAIYSRENKKDKLWQYLTVKRQKRMRKGGRHVHKDSRIPEAVSIDQRPKSVNNRKKIGHWETDNVIGKQADKTALSVTVERKLRLTIISKLTAKTASEKTKKLFERLSVFPDKIRKTMTADNGPENTNHKQITESLSLDMFFCHAYHSWERGTVENTNGRIRKFIPKGMSIDGITEKEIAAIEVRMNNTPRKCLGYMTPYEKLQEYLKRV
jgi:IS30 family transposase